MLNSGFIEYLRYLTTMMSRVVEDVEQHIARTKSVFLAFPVDVGEYLIGSEARRTSAGTGEFCDEVKDNPVHLRLVGLERAVIGMKDFAEPGMLKLKRGVRERQRRYAAVAEVDQPTKV